MSTPHWGSGALERCAHLENVLEVVHLNVAAHVGFREAQVGEEEHANPERVVHDAQLGADLVGGGRHRALVRVGERVVVDTRCPERVELALGGHDAQLAPLEPFHQRDDRRSGCDAARRRSAEPRNASVARGTHPGRRWDPSCATRGPPSRRGSPCRRSRRACPARGGSWASRSTTTTWWRRTGEPELLRGVGKGGSRWGQRADRRERTA